MLRFHQLQGSSKSRPNSMDVNYVDSWKTWISDGKRPKIQPSTPFFCFRIGFNGTNEGCGFCSSISQIIVPINGVTLLVLCCFLSGFIETTLKLTAHRTKPNSFGTVDGRNPKQHLRCMKPWKTWYKLPTSTGDRRISEPSTVTTYFSQEESSGTVSRVQGSPRGQYLGIFQPPQQQEGRSW